MAKHGLATLAIAAMLMAMTTTSLRADSVITIKSDLTNLGAAVDSTSDPRLTSGDVSGLIFIPVTGDTGGTYTTVPAGATLVQVPPDCGYYCGQSGFVETTFTLPAFTSISLTGVGNVDDWGYVFLNGHLISPQLTEYGNISFSTSNTAYFVAGVNTFMISDSNSGGGPSGVAYVANITYSPVSTPEPGAFLLLVTTLASLAGIVRRRIGTSA